MNNAQPLPADVPASGTFFPTETLERLTGSQIVMHASGDQSTIKLADGRTGTYRYEPAPNGGSTWHLRQNTRSERSR